MKTLLLALALTSLTASAAPQQDDAAPRRIVVVLAGQSNIEYLALKNPSGCSTGGPRANVQ